jgi:imidazoleglycerol-phosphate dehydratase
MDDRAASVERTTRETSVSVTVDLGGGEVSTDTGVPFFDHMLDQLGRHARIGLSVSSTGDLAVDAHHTVEDTGLALGEAIAKALGDKRGIRRYGDALVPMEESLAQVALDISGRPLLVYDAAIPAQTIGAFDVGLTEEFLMAMARSGGLTLHVKLIEAKNGHHAVEAIFKAVARALGDAIARNEKAGDDIPSTKGVL